MSDIRQVTVPSESNLRQIIRILVGLMDSQQQLEQQCVLPYIDDGSKIYTSPMLTIHNDGSTYGLYMCKYTTSGEWNANSWIEICSVELEELTPSDIDAYMAGVAHETWDYFKNIINDDTVSTTKVWSSSKTYEEIQESYADSIAYTVKYVAKAKLITYKKVTSIADVKDESTLYLVPDASGNYSIWVLDSSTGDPLQLSDTSIDLSDYYTKTESDDTFESKSHASSTYKDIASYGTEQGNLSFQTTAQNVTDAINEVNSKLSNYVPLAGGELTGNLVFVNNIGTVDRARCIWFDNVRSTSTEHVPAFAESIKYNPAICLGKSGVNGVLYVPDIVFTDDNGKVSRLAEAILPEPEPTSINESSNFEAFDNRSEFTLINARRVGNRVDCHVELKVLNSAFTSISAIRTVMSIKSSSIYCNPSVPSYFTWQVLNPDRTLKASFSGHVGSEQLYYVDIIIPTSGIIVTNDILVADFTYNTK